MWFSVNLLYEGVHPGRPVDANLWEERLVLVDADSEDAAGQQAERLARADECQYVSATGEEVQWRFRGIERVHTIDSPGLTNGTELFSRFLRAGEAAALQETLAEENE